MHHPPMLLRVYRIDGVGIRLSRLPGWPAGIQHWGMPGFFFLTRPEIAQFSMWRCWKHSFASNKTKISCIWSVECVTWGILGVRCDQSYWLDSHIFLIFRWHILHSSILRSGTMMGIFQEDNIDVDDDYGLMLPQMKALLALHLTLREKHMNIRRYALRIIKPLSLSGGCWKYKQSWLFSSGSLPTTTSNTDFADSGKAGGVQNGESHWIPQKENHTKSLYFCPANFWNGWECHCLLPHLEGCASLLGCGGL